MRGGLAWPSVLMVLLVSLAAAAGLGAESQPQVVMLGDSLTAGYDWAARLPQARVDNQGVSGDNTGQILARLDRVIAAGPQIVFLQAGINDFGRRDRDTEILGRHRAIWHKLKSELPGLRLVLVSLLPVAEDRYPGLNIKIMAFNHRLRQAAEKEGLIFVDLFSLLVDQAGQLPRKYTYDGLHLTPAAYEIWLTALRPYLPGGEQ